MLVDIDDLRHDISKIIKDTKEQQKKVNRKYNKQVKENLNKIAISSINRFYDYETNYKRKWDLYNAYKVNVNSREWSILFDSKYMHEHGSLNDYIFNIAFLDGYHGGANSGRNHPNPGEPWLRGGYNFSQWLRPATLTESPFHMISKEATRYLDETKQKSQDEFEKPIIEELNKFEHKLDSLI